MVPRASNNCWTVDRTYSDIPEPIAVAAEGFKHPQELLAVLPFQRISHNAKRAREAFVIN